MPTATKKAVALEHLESLATRANARITDVAGTAARAIAQLAGLIPGQMEGATEQAAGEGGTVPDPAAGDNAKFLRGDGTWATPSMAGAAFRVSTSNPSASDTDIMWIKAQSLN